MPDITIKRERTDRWTKMRLSRARSSGTAASCHMLSSVDCITTTSESEFSVHTGGPSKTLAVTVTIGAERTRRGHRKTSADAPTVPLQLWPRDLHGLCVPKTSSVLTATESPNVNGDDRAALLLPQTQFARPLN